MMIARILLLVLVSLTSVHPLDNGLARTPPMGWMSWERYGCNQNCHDYPDDCLSEKLIKAMADRMAKDGYLAAGYQYIALDDCWMAPNRTSDGKLQADKYRFPSGIKNLADYVHNLGLKLGVYLDIGTKTCAGFPGSDGHKHDDAQTLAQWGVDMVKFDGCNADPHALRDGYPQFGKELNATGRPILYACQWPLYERISGIQPDYGLIAKTCNTFRSYAGIGDGWDALYDIIKHFADNPDNISAYGGPGHWSDPDQMVVGDYGLSEDQQEMQMAVWSMMASPLFMSVDLRHVTNFSRSILQNKMAIAISQDPLGVMAKQIRYDDGVRIWLKPIMPKGSFALAFVYGNISGGPKKIPQFKLEDIGMTTADRYRLTDVFKGSEFGIYRPWFYFNGLVNPTGVLFLHAEALRPGEEADRLVQN